MIIKTEHDQKQCPNRQGGNRYRQQDYDQQLKSSSWKKNLNGKSESMMSFLQVITSLL